MNSLTAFGLSLFLSGCNSLLNFLYAFLIADNSALAGIPMRICGTNPWSGSMSFTAR